MKKIILLGILLIVPSVFAVTLSGSGSSTITFTEEYSIGRGGAERAYWAAWLDVSTCGTGISVDCSAHPYVDCNYNLADTSIRVVSYTAPAGGSWAITNVNVAVTGTGTCTINNYDNVESYYDAGNERLGPVEQSTNAGFSLVMGSGCVAMNELLDAIGQWKVGSLQMDDLLTLIGEWKSNPC